MVEDDNTPKITEVDNTDDFLYPPPSADAGPAAWATWTARVYVEACLQGVAYSTATNLAVLAEHAESCGMASASVGIRSILAQLLVSK